MKEFIIPVRFSTEVTEEYVYYLNNQKIRKIIVESLSLALYVIDDFYAYKLEEEISKNFLLYRKDIDQFPPVIKEYAYSHLSIDLVYRYFHQYFRT